MGKRRNRNQARVNNRTNSVNIMNSIYSIIVSNDVKKNMCNRMLDEDTYEDDMYEIIEDVVSDMDLNDEDRELLINTFIDASYAYEVTNGLNTSTMLLAVEEWLKTATVDKYSIADAMQSFSFYLEKNSPKALDAYTATDVVAGAIFDKFTTLADYSSVGYILAITMSVIKCLRIVVDKGAVTTAASESTDEEKISETIIEEVEETRGTTEEASVVDEEELKDKIDVESLAQDVISGLTPGEMKSLMFDCLIESCRKAKDMISDNDFENNPDCISEIILNAFKESMESIGDIKTSEPVPEPVTDDETKTSEEPVKNSKSFGRRTINRVNKDITNVKTVEETTEQTTIDVDTDDTEYTDAGEYVMDTVSGKLTSGDGIGSVIARRMLGLETNEESIKTPKMVNTCTTASEHKKPVTKLGKIAYSLVHM